jgi:hypothetical protein
MAAIMTLACPWCGESISIPTRLASGIVDDDPVTIGAAVAPDWRPLQAHVWDVHGVWVGAL